MFRRSDKMMMAEESKNMPAAISLGRKIAYGAMGSAAAASSLLAGTCVSRCNGCMGCLVGGAGLVGIIVGSKMLGKFSGSEKAGAIPVAENEVIIINKRGGEHENPN
jgi:hypothetical protein